MNAESVAGWLAAIGVPAGVVSVGAEADDAWCLLRDDSVLAENGEQAPEWEVFWREQGNRYDWARFTNEQVACFYLFGRLAWTQLASGVLNLPPPAQPAATDTADGTEPAPAAAGPGAAPAEPGQAVDQAQAADQAAQPAATEPAKAQAPAT